MGTITVPIKFDTIPIRVIKIDRIAYTIIRHTIQTHTVVQRVLHRLCQIAAGWINESGVKNPRLAMGTRPAPPLYQVLNATWW